MSPEETKERIRAAIDSFIKNDAPENDEAQKAIHDVLAAKMRDRINPPVDEPVEVETEVEPEPVVEPEAE